MLTSTANQWCWCLCCSGQPCPCSQELGAVSGLGLAVLFSRAGRAGWPTSPPCLWELRPRQQDRQPGKEQEKDGVQALSWAPRQGGDRWPGGCVSRRALSRTFWASLNCCRNAHLDTSFCRTGRKRNNGGWGKGRERRTPTHKPKLIPGIYCEITAKVLWAPLLPLAKHKCKVSLSVSLSSSYAVFRRCFVKHREQKIQIPKPEY